MAKTADEIVIGANGSVMLAAVGTTLPVDIDAPFGAGFTDLGYTSEDGVTITDSRDIADIPVWQLFYPPRKIITGKDLQVAFVLRQFNGRNVEVAFGGGEVTSTASGFKYDPPAPDVIDERALGVEWLDGDKTYRLIVPRCLIVENVETQVVRTAAVDLPLTFGVLGQDNVNPYYFLSNDDSWGDVIGS